MLVCAQSWLPLVFQSYVLVLMMEAAGDLGHKLLSQQMEESDARCNFDLWEAVYVAKSYPIRRIC